MSEYVNHAYFSVTCVISNVSVFSEEIILLLLKICVSFVNPDMYRVVLAQDIV